MESSQGKVTLATIAREVGVSAATVSNAFSRPDQLSAPLRERILATARRLGYAGPNPVASALRRGRTGAVGLVFDDPVSYAFADPAETLLLQGVAEVCDQHGTGIVLIPGGLDSALAQHGLVDGFLCHSDRTDPAPLASLRRRGMPLVVIDGPAPGDVARVYIDDRAAARVAAQHLIDLGHRRLAVITTPLSPVPAGGPVYSGREARAHFQVPLERLAGYRDAVQEHPSTQILETVEATALTREAGRAAALHLLERPASQRPTAILAMSDELAAGALHAAQHLALPVPENLSVVGFDDTPTAADRGLTTIHQPHREKGRLAATILTAHPPQQERHRRLDTVLTIRSTTARPSGRD